MGSEEIARDGPAGTPEERRFSVVWVLIAIVLVLATCTTIHGLSLLTGSYLLAIPVGLAAQAILLIVSLRIGSDIARLASGRAGEEQVSGAARWMRSLLLGAAYLLLFGICWFFAFSGTYDVLLERGSDVETTSTHAAQLADAALLPARREVDLRPQAAAAELREHGPVADYLRQLREMTAGRRPEVVPLREARQRYASERQQVRAELTRQRAGLLGRQGAVQTDIGNTEQALAAARQELAALPLRIINLRRAFAEEQTGALPPPQEAPTPSEVQSPPAPGARQAEPAAAPPPQANETPPANPSPAPSIWLRPDGLAATLVREPACRFARQPGTGPCYRALETALQGAGPRERELVRLIAQQEDSLSGLRDEAQSLPEQLAGVDRQLAVNPPLPQPANPGTNDLGRLSETRDQFARALNESDLIALVDECRPIAVALRALPERERPAMLQGFDCRPDAVANAVGDRQQLEAASRDFANLCGSGPTRQRVEAIVARLRADLPPNGGQPADITRSERRARALDDVRRTIIDPCLAAASLAGVAPDPFTRQATDFESRVSPRQSGFSLASNTAVQVLSLQATSPAYLGAVLAFGPAAAILLLSILRNIDLGAPRMPQRLRDTPAKPSFHVGWAPRDGDPPDVAGAKLLLRARTDRANGSAVVAAGFAADARPDIKTSAQQLLGKLIRDGHAQASTFGNRIWLAPEAIDEAERIVEDNYAKQGAGMNVVPRAQPMPDAVTTPVPG